jgi:subtilisin-like proprotein convertase family protein
MKNKLLILFFGIIMSFQMSYAQVPSYVPSNGLQSYWPFNGNANDQSVNAFNGVVNGAISTTDRLSNNNSAYSFNGTNSIRIPHNNVFNSYPLTLSAWIQTDAGFTSGGGDIISKYITASWNGWELNLEIINNNSARIIPSYLRSASPCNGVIEGYAICNNPTGMNHVGNLNNRNWHHLVFRIDANGGVLYVNGQQVSQQIWIGSPGRCTNSTQITIGQGFKGKIDDVGIWNRALTQSEIQQLYTACSPPTIALSSPSGTSNQSVNNNTTITPIQYTIGSGSTGTTVTGLPPGVTSTIIGNSVTISGAPSNIGTFNYTVTATGTCGNATSTGTITVANPPTLFITSISNNPICSGSNAVFNVIGSPNTIVTYSINGGPNQTLQLNTSGAGVITVTNPTNNVNLLVSRIQLGNNFDTTPLTRNLIVNPSGQVNPIPNQLVCNESLSMPVFFSPANTGGTTTYTWTNNNPSIGLVASGTGDIPSFVAMNTSNAPYSANITVVPTYTNGGLSCVGDAETFTITINPTHQISNITASICSGTTFSVTPADGSGNIVPSGTTYTWTISSNTNITGASASSATGNSAISQTLINTSNTTQTITYTVTPTSGTCVGAPFTVTLDVNPIPVILEISSTICSGTAFSVTPTNGGWNIVPSGTTYTWTAPISNPGGVITGGTAQATGIATISQLLTNTSNTTQTIIYTVTPNSGTCVGSDFPIDVDVNPTPILILSSAATTTNQTICANSPIVPIQYTFDTGATGVTVTGLPAGVNYTLNGNIVTISGTPTTTAAVFNYTVTAIGNSCGNPSLSGVIEVTNGILPTFAQIASVCQGDTINLPTSSLNSPAIVGVWNLISSTANDVTYQFTPNSGQCVLNTTMTIEVRQCIPIQLCGQSFFDSGGGAANYSTNENRNVTIVPSAAGEVVTVTFTSFNIETNFDALYVYDGPNTSSPLLSSGNGAGSVPGGVPGGFWGTTNPGTFTSSHPTGALTFVFRSGNTGVRSGWTSNVTCAPRPNYCAGDHFYDLGGPSGNYPNNLSSARGYTKICPDAGQSVTVFFNSFDVVNDTLSIYDGDNLATALLVGTYSGTSIIPSYTANNPTGNGCLIFVFTSNATANASGWDASIVCGAPCQSITSSIASSTPAPAADTVIRVCQDQAISLNGAATFGTNGSGATYHWNFGDNTTAVGQNITHSYSNPGIYSINLYTEDVNGCRSVNQLNQLVYVSTDPSFAGTAAADDEICLGQSTTITGIVTPTTFNGECIPPVSGTSSLPDGSGVSYQTSVPIDCFTSGTTLTSANQITSVCINMEHSFLGDLDIRLISPSGQSIILKAYNGTGGGGAGTYLGCPNDDPSTVPGTGRNYCFTPTATTFLVNGPTSACGNPSSASVNAGNYMPVQPFTNLIGSALNGNWSLIVTDNLAVDNGYIFNWTIDFDNSLINSNHTFTPTIASSFWSPDPSIVSNSGQNITVTPTVLGTNCYTYNVVDNFGCTYSHEVCIETTPGASLTTNTASPLSVFVGQDGTFTFSGGTPLAVVTYNINGGANQTVFLNANGTAIVNVSSLMVNTTLTVTGIAEQPIPTSGNAILTTGGVNPTNSTGPISPVGTVANTSNCTTINSANSIISLRLADQLPIGTVVTISIARTSVVGSAQISDGTNTIVYNSGPNNVLQRISFTMGRSTDVITITHNVGTIYVDGISYTFNRPGCDTPLNLPATIQVSPPTYPYITSISNNSICLGADAIFNVIGSANTTVTYTINNGPNQTLILDAVGTGIISAPIPTTNVVLLVSQIQLGIAIEHTTLSRTIIVNPEITVTGPPSALALCINSLLMITHTTTGATGIGTVTGLPAGTFAYFSGNTITISGTPVVSGAFNYSIPLTGGCNTVVATGIIIVNPNNTVTPSSGPQTLCINTTLAIITHSTTGATGIGTPTGLPSGVTASWAANTIAISGTPFTSGIFNYNIPLTGGCGIMNATGTIIVENGILPIFVQVEPVCQGTTINIPNGSLNTPPIFGDWILISSTPNNVTYEFMPWQGQCALNTTMTIVVNPLPIVSPSSTTQSFCSGGTTNINLVSNLPGAVFNWTASSTSVNGQSSSIIGSGATSINQTLILNANQVDAGQVTYSIVAEANGCIGAPVNVDVIVNPIPNVVFTPNHTICSGTSTDIWLFGNIPNTVFSWNVISSIGVNGAFNETGYGIYQTLTTTSNAQGTVVYEVTPVANGCAGMPQQITVTVEPNVTPTVNVIQPSCNMSTGQVQIISPLGSQYEYSLDWNNFQTSPNFNSLTPGDHYIIVRNLFSDCYSNPAVITIDPMPAVVISSTNNICIGATANLFFNGTPNATVIFNVNNGNNQSIILDDSGFAVYTSAPLTTNTLFNLVSVTSGNTTCTQNLGNPVLVTVSSCIPNSGFHLNAFFDSNNNGIQDLGEVNIPFGQFHYQVNNIIHNIFSFSGMFDIAENNPSTSYSFAYTINSAFSNFFIVNPLTYTNVRISANGGITNINFAVTLSSFTDLSITNIPISPPIPGFTYQHMLLYSNNGLLSASGNINFIKDTAVSMVSVSEPSAVVNSNGFTYNFTNLQPFQNRSIIATMYVPALPNVSLGQLLISSASINSSSGVDLIPSNNNSSSFQFVGGSYDPNDIMESHGRDILHSSFSSEDYLYYTIRFENTGNANAINISIDNLIDSKLDESTLEMVSSSHNSIMDRITNTVNWKFNNIQLPPSDPNSNVGKGYIMYKIKPKAGYAIGDIIPNTAAIYFDTNPAVITNTFETEFVTQLSTPEYTKNTVTLYPNPTKGILYLSVGNSYLDFQELKLKIVNALGQVIDQIMVRNSNEEITTKNWGGSGLYFVQILNEQGEVLDIKKIILE